MPASEGTTTLPTTTTTTHKNAKKSQKVIFVNLALENIRNLRFLTKGAQIRGNSMKLRKIVIKIGSTRKNS